MKLKRLALVLTISVAMVATSISTAFACTSLFVGKNISKNGSRYISRTEDMSDNYCKIFGIKEAADHEEGEIYEDTYGFSMPYPAHTYKYSYIRDSEKYDETVMDANGNPVGEAYAAAGQNEKGVSMTATVSTNYNRNVLRSVDPLVGTGICEISIPSVVLGVANNARHACEYLGSIIDQYGAGECNSILISDANESWDFEIVSGHQWVALKLDNDRASFNPNIMLMQAVDVNDTENVICSANLVNLPKEKGFLVTDSKGNIEVAKTYGSSAYRSYNTRILQGLYFLNPEELGSQYTTTSVSNDNPNPFYVTPSWALDLHDIMHFQAYRGAGSPEDQDGEHISRSVRSIGTNGQTECHIFETRDGYPLELATIQWQCMEDAEFSIFLPQYTALMTEVDKSYAENAIRFKDVAKGTSMNWNFSEINNLCNRNRANNVGKNVKAYFNDYQDALIEKQKTVDEEMLELFKKDPAEATAMANRLSKDLTRQALEMSTTVLEELQAYIEAGDFEKEFTPSPMEKNLMPMYSLPEEGIEEAQAKAKEDVDAAFDLSDYLKADQEKIEALKETLKESIDAATTIERAEYIADNAQYFARDIKTIADILDDADQAIADAQAAAAEANAKAEAAQATADEANAKAEAAQATADEAKAKAEAAQAELDAAKAKINANESQIASLENAVKSAQAAAAEANAAAESAKKAADEANTQLAAAKEQNEALQKELENVKTEVASSKTDNAADYSALMDRINKLEAELAKENVKEDVAAAEKINAKAYPAAEAKEVADALAAYKALAAEPGASAAELREAAAILKTATDKAVTAKKAADAAKLAAAKNYTVKGLKVKAGAKKATITFKRTKGATAYQVQYKLGKKAWKNVAKSTKKAKVVAKKLKKGKKYSFRVRTITTVNGTKAYGKWTKAKTVKIK